MKEAKQQTVMLQFLASFFSCLLSSPLSNRLRSSDFEGFEVTVTSNMVLTVDF
jgi:hypothetical protein